MAGSVLRGNDGRRGPASLRSATPLPLVSGLAQLHLHQCKRRERAGRVCNNEHALAIAAGAADDQAKGGASAVRCAPPPRAVLPGIDACGYLRRSVMLQRSSGVSSSSPFSSVLENESECGELAALHAMGHTPARTANCPACSACAFAAETAAREGGKRPNMTMCCRRRVRTAVVSPRACGT